MSRRFAGLTSTGPVHNPHRHSNIIHGFQKLWMASAAGRIREKRFRLLELPLPENRLEFEY